MSKLLGDFLKSNDFYLNPEIKNEFKKLGTLFLNRVSTYLVERMPGEVVFDFNPGGIAVSGSFSFYFMPTVGSKGIYCNFSAEHPSMKILMRSINDFKDYSGGVNRWFNIDLLNYHRDFGDNCLKLLREFNNERT